MVLARFPGASALAESRNGSGLAPFGGTTIGTGTGGMMGNWQPTPAQVQLMHTPEMQQLMQSQLNGKLTPEQLEKMQKACGDAARQILQDQGQPVKVQ